MSRVVHFEIQADNPERAAAFYREVFGWSIERWDNPNMEYWIVMTAAKGSKEQGINGGLLKRPGKAPKKDCGANAFVCTVEVKSFDEFAKRIFDAGGTILMPKFALPKMAWQGYFLDTEGNAFGLHQADPNAE